MFGKIIGGVTGAKAAKHARGVSGPGGALLGAGAVAAMRRFGPLALLAAGAGYAFKRYSDQNAGSGKSGKDRRSSSISEKLALEETPYLISSEKVDGTAVYNREGEKLGTVHHFMVGKRDGRVHYAVMNFGGLFGMGVKHYPLPWDVLDYETDKGGYVVDLRKEQLDPDKLPSFAQDQEQAWDANFVRTVRVYWFPTQA